MPRGQSGIVTLVEALKKSALPPISTRRRTPRGYLRHFQPVLREPSPIATTIDPDLTEVDGECVARYGNVTLRTHFQPIYSLSHRRVVGHEALLRARDPSGLPISPPALFDRCRTIEELRRLDWLGSLTHCANFGRAQRPDEWLFLNVHPGTFAGSFNGKRFDLRTLFGDAIGLKPQQIVIEVLEDAMAGVPEFEAEVVRLRELGCLIALDDFGAGHSNFDRVWRLRPDIVKLDRSVIVRAASDRGVRRVTSQMVSMLHECGSLVLMEGIETADEAHIALESDVDFVQGYYFGFPQARLTAPKSRCEPLESAWDLFDERWTADRNQYRARIAPYRHAVAGAAKMLGAGVATEDACREFLDLANAETAYLLDADGFQVGRNIYARSVATGPDSLHKPARYAPLRDTRNARWSRRPYFRRALNSIGEVQVTRPYLTMQSSRLCVTVSMSFRLNGQTLIVCGDVIWEESSDSPIFAATGNAAIL
ncbi:EAL domain-containing protein [soil metagenome]